MTVYQDCDAVQRGVVLMLVLVFEASLAWLSDLNALSTQPYRADIVSLFRAVKVRIIQSLLVRNVHQHNTHCSRR